MRPVYFHGIPGSAREVALAGVQPEGLSPEADAGPGRHFVGFSLGAHRALLAAVAHSAARIDLVAPAAPLELGNFLPRMAGRPVFDAAQRGRLGRLATLQGTMLRLSPALTLRFVFAGSAPADLRLIRPGPGRDILVDVLRESLLGDPENYRSAVESYVQPWADILPRVSCPVRIWHGRDDTWAPYDMGEALRDAIPGAELIPLPGLGHYSALVEALPRILCDADQP